MKYQTARRIPIALAWFSVALSVGALLTKVYLGTGPPGLIHWVSVGFCVLALPTVYALDRQTKRKRAEHEQFMAKLRNRMPR